MSLTNSSCQTTISPACTLQTGRQRLNSAGLGKIARLGTLSEIDRPVLLWKPTKLLKANNIRICL